MAGMDGVMLVNRPHELGRDIRAILITGGDELQLAVLEGAYVLASPILTAVNLEIVEGPASLRRRQLLATAMSPVLHYQERLTGRS